MTPQMIGLAGGIAGGVFGLLGGVIGTYFSIKNSRTEAERRLMIRWAAAIWLLTLALIIVPTILVVLKMIPSWVSWALWMAYLIPLLRSIPRINRRAQELRGSSQPAHSS